MENARTLISGCILARNEAGRIEDALKSLQGWTDQLIVIDNESEDETVAIAERYGALILSAPRAANFDGARNLAIEHASGEWIFYLDADERVPAALGPILRRMVEEHGHDFEALMIPFRNWFCGEWIQHSGWWPSYTRPQLVKNGCFHYGERLHSGVQVQGRTRLFPADNPDLAITHYSYDDLHHYLAKINNYTDGEAETLLLDGKSHAWQAQLAHFVTDWRLYYERGHGDLDGMHGFVLAFLSAFYRFASRTKLWDLRRKRGEVDDQEPVPTSLAEMLAFMTQAAQGGHAEWLTARAPAPAADRNHIPTDWLAASGASEAPSDDEPAVGERTGITGCILARNEAGRIEAALKSLRPWVDEIIVIDNESEDATAAIAERYGARILTAPRAASFDGARNLAIEQAKGDWILFLDADERIPEKLGSLLGRLVRERGAEFEAVCFPFKNYYYGKWMQCPIWWPGYKGPQLLKKGAFHFGERLHAGAQVHGRTLQLPAGDADLAILHYACDDIRHYLTKLNNYTDGEAENLYADGQSHTWQAQLAHFVHDWQVHYDRGQAHRDGMAGFVQAFLCSFYRFVSRAKLWDLRRKRGETRADEPVPATLGEMLAFMAQVAQEGAGRWLTAAHAPVAQSSQPAPLLWRGPIFDASGYADDGRNLVLGLLEAGQSLALAPDRWNEETVALAPGDQAQLDAALVSPETPAEMVVLNTLPPLIRPIPNAGFHIARTVFETERLPDRWADVLNAMDRIWVPTEFNREGFVSSGIDPQKIAVVPEAIDPAPFAAEVAPYPLPGEEAYTFLSVFDWSLHKGWDLLLEAFARTFANEPNVGLVIKTWSSNRLSLADILAQADAHLQARIGKSLADFPNIHIWQERLSADEMPRLYRAADCFVIPTRCEGWCRPLMEAMASGLPTIATAWSGLTAFHNEQVGYPLKHALVPVSEAGAREIPFYAGHRWAEPDLEDLQRLMRHVVDSRDAAREKGIAAQQAIARDCARPVVAALLRAEIARCREIAAYKARTASFPSPEVPPTHNTALLIQSAVGEHTRLLDLTRARHEAYARAHNMDFVCRSGLQQPDRHPNWDKIALILQALRKGSWETIVWLDADTLIADLSRDLRSALPAGKWLGMVRHGNPPWFNAGAIYLRSTPESLAFFEEVWRMWPAEHHWEDNMSIIRVLGFDPARFTGVAVIGDEWNSTRLMNASSHPVVMAWHANGSISERLQMMQAALEGDLSRQQASVAQAASANPGAIGPLLRPSANPVPIDPVPDVDFRQALGRPLRVRWEGAQTVVSSLAHVNREICLRLLAYEDIELSLPAGSPSVDLADCDSARFAPLFARAGAALSGPPDVTVRHHWPPDWRRPAAGKLVVMQPWELSHLPGYDWLEGATHQADEVWAYSRFVRDIYVRSGVPAEKVRIVPLGVRAEAFAPDGAVFALPLHPHSGARPFRFLFVGGTVDRKGADLLLDTYLRSFTVRDPVCLVVKDLGMQTFYRGQNLEAVFRQAQADPNAPQVVYLDQELSEAELASLYRACDCVVLPYRGEGFGLVPLEGMACGVPAIVTAGGATDDYLDDTMALRVPHYRRRRPGILRGPAALPVDPWDLQPDPKALSDALHWAVEHAAETRGRGEKARTHAAGWTWERAVGIARQRLLDVVSPPAERPVVPAVLWSEPVGQRKPVEAAASREIELSLCMIVRNEEARLASCLESIRPYVDEMVVVDTGSSDATREIARDCGARVFDCPWPDSFAAARNQSLDQARGKWIFWMDADDVITPECGLRLKEEIRLHPDLNTAIHVQVRILPRPGEFGSSVVDHVKLFPNRPDPRFEHRIHEQILPAIRRAKLKVCFSDLYVTHQNYDRSPEGQARKRLRDYRLLDLDLADRPNHPFVLFNLGMTHLLATKEFEVAAHYLRRSLNGSDWRDSIVRKAYAMLTSARMCQEEWQAAVAANEEGRGHYPDDAELLFQAGRVYPQVGRLEEARQALERLIAGKDDPHYRSVDVGLRGYRGRHALALLLRQMGDAAAGERMLREILAEQPDYTLAWQDLVEPLSRMGQALPPSAAYL